MTNQKASNKIEKQEYRVLTDSWYTTVIFMNRTQARERTILLEAFEEYDSFLGGVTEEEFIGMAWIEVVEHSGVSYKESSPLGFDEMKELAKDPYKNRKKKVVREIQSIRQVIVQSENESGVEFIHSPHDIARFVTPIIGDVDREVLFAIYLNTKNRIIGVEKISVGTVNSSLAHPREIIKGAVLCNASTYILCHQHPTGNPNPSNEDLMITEKMKDIGELVDIPLLDHVIVTSDETKYVSLRQQGHF